MDEATNLEFDGLCFDLEKSLRYHQRRRAFLEQVHRWIMFGVICFGSASAASTFSWISGASLAFVVALLGAIDLVWAPGQRARDHLILHQRYSSLVASIARRLPDTAAEVGELKARRIEIENDEPPIYWALEADCYNEVCYALGRADPKNLPSLTKWQRRLMNVIRFERVTLPSNPTPAADGG